MKSRRQFLKVAGLSVLGLAGALSGAARVAEAAPGTVGAAKGPAYAVGKEALQGKHWGMVINTRAFDTPEKFEAVISACHRYHNVPNVKDRKHQVKWIWTDGYHETFTDQMDNYPAQDVLERRYLMLCNQCANPSCVRACPTRATFVPQNSGGIVVMDYHRCIACRYCMAACPYGARSYNFVNPRKHLKPEDINPAFPTRMGGMVEKCTFCIQLLAVGKLPLCVEASQGAIIFGDLADPASDVRKVLAENFTIRRKPTLGTEPSVYYII